MKRTIIFAFILLAGCSTCKRCYGEILDATTVLRFSNAINEAFSRDDYATAVPRAIIRGLGVATIPTGTATVEVTRAQLGNIQGIIKRIESKKVDAEVSQAARIIIPATATVELRKNYEAVLAAMKAGKPITVGAK